MKGAGCSIAADGDIFANDFAFPPSVGVLSFFGDDNIGWSFFLGLGFGSRWGLIILFFDEFNFHIGNKTLFY